MLIDTPFVPLSLTALHDERISAGAVRVLLVLQEHARRKNICWPSQARIAERARCSERSVRNYLDQLESADYIRCIRRGQRKTNLYQLIHTSTGQTAFPERQKKAVELEKKEFEKTFDSYPHHLEAIHNGDNSDSTLSTYIANPLLSEEEKIVCPAPIARLADDVGKEMRDKSPLSTRTRIARIHQKSGLSVNEFMTEALAARAITRQRLGRIQKRAANSGQALPMAYMLAVLANRLNLGEKTHQKPLQTPQNLDVKVSPPPPIFVRSRPSDEARAAFWRAIRDATGIEDLPSYCRATGRNPIYDDTKRSIQIVKDKR